MASKNRELLDQTALRLFALRGVSEVSIRDIAGAMEVPLSTLYRHMTSKEDLVTRIFTEAYHRLSDRLLAAMAGIGPLEHRIAAVLRASLAAYDDDPDLVRFLLMRQHDVLGRLPPDRPNPPQTPLAILRALCAEGVASGQFAPVYSPDQATAVMTGLILQPMIFAHYGTLSTPVLAHLPMVSHALTAALFKR